MTQKHDARSLLSAYLHRPDRLARALIIGRAVGERPTVSVYSHYRPDHDSAPRPDDGAAKATPDGGPDGGDGGPDGSDGGPHDSDDTPGQGS